MNKPFFSLLILPCLFVFFLFVSDISAGVGVTTRGAGLSIGNIKSEGKVIDGIALHIGTPFHAKIDPAIDEVNGLAIALAPASRKVNGLLISPLFAKTRAGTTGIAIGLIQAGGETTKGLALSGYSIDGKDLSGLALSSFVSFKNSMNGIAIGVVGSFAEKAKGLVIGGLYAVPTEMRGITIGGILSGADRKMTGLSIGLVNGADILYGVQIGAYNVAKELHGIQIGIFNIAENNTFLPWFPVINAHF